MLFHPPAQGSTLRERERGKERKDWRGRERKSGVESSMSKSRVEKE